MKGRFRGHGVLVLGAVLAGLTLAAPAAADVGDGRLGGPPEPSTPAFDDASCPEGAVLTAVTGGTGTPGGNTTVATITAQCTGPGGPVTGSTMGEPNSLDGSGGSSCPAGQVAVGIEGREGDFLDQLVLRCQAADLTGPISPAASSFGGTGGGPDGPYDCPAGEALVGLGGEVVFSATMVRYVEISCSAAAPPPASTTGPAITTPTGTTSQTVPPPVLGLRLNVQKVRGQVLIAIPVGPTGSGRAAASQKGLRFVPLEQVRQIPVGSFLDTSRGTVRLTTARDTAGSTQSGDFSAGLFQVLQSRSRSARGLTDVVLKGSSFRSCGRAARSGAADAAARRKRTVRRLRANARGRFRTRGRYSAATVRGTKWTVTDRCDGTLTKVSRGSVVVRDFRRRRNVTVRAGKRTRGGGLGSYLARAR